MRRAACLAALSAALAVVGCGSSSSGSQPAASSQSGARSHAAGHRSGRLLSGPRTVERLVMPAHPVAHTVRVPILTYHRVHLFATEFTKSIPDETVEPDRFRTEMDALAANGYHTVSQAQLFHALFDGVPLPPKPVMITVDDGYVDDVTQIL